MSRKRYFYFYLLAFIASLVSFAIGLRVGVTQFVLAQSTVKATLLVGELQALRDARRIEFLIQAKEMELDTEILMYSRSLEEGHAWLLWPESADMDRSRYLRNIANYRKKYPPVLPTVPIVGNDLISEEMRINALQVIRATEDILKKYGNQ